MVAKVEGKMKYTLSKRETYIMLDKNNVPVACGRITKEDDGYWFTSLMVSRKAKHGTCKKLIKLMIKKVPYKENISIGMSYDNYAMIKCALDGGFKIVERDEYGYILRRKK